MKVIAQSHITFAYTNYVYANENIIPGLYSINNTIFIVKTHKDVPVNCIALSVIQRTYLHLMLDSPVLFMSLDKSDRHLLPDNCYFKISKIKKNDTTITITIENIYKELKGLVINPSQKLAILIDNIPLLCEVIDLYVPCIINNISIIESRDIIIIDPNKKKSCSNILSMNFEELGIGGLDKEFSEIFRRAFISRIYSSDIVKNMGIKHVKGLILYGPSGTGKTLISRKIAQTLTNKGEFKEPKIINGP